MKSGFIKSTIVGGLFFILPLTLFIFLLGKAIGMISGLLESLFPGLKYNTLAGFVIYQLIGVVLVIAFCFAAGLLSKTRIALRFVRWIEANLLSLIPGYQFMKSMRLAQAGIEEDEDTKVVLTKVDDGWQISFLIEQIDDNNYTVFIPDAPRPFSGSIYHVEKHQIKSTDLTKKQAFDCIKNLGLGSAKILKDKFGKEG